MKKAFTLSEILITILIIGTVCAMTIPNLIQNQQEQETVVSLKKAYSTLSNAYTLAVQENGTPDFWGLTVGADPKILSNIFPYLHINKDCTDGSKGCFPPGVRYKYLAPNMDALIFDDENYPKAKLSDGMLLIGWVNNATCENHIGDTPALNSICGRYWVDINGYKNPNQYGKDLFQFHITKYGIIPFGVVAQTADYTFENSCKTQSTAKGTGCTAWVIYNENMDYLHCNDLSWDGKHTCD